jgi:hypothetical protein
MTESEYRDRFWKQGKKVLTTKHTKTMKIAVGQAFLPDSTRRGSDSRVPANAIDAELI